MSPTIEAALKRMSQLRVALLGDFILDTYVYGQTIRVSREAPVPVVRKEREEARLGGAANTARNLLALGAKTHLVGVMDEDDAGRVAREKLQTHGAHVDGLRPGRPTPVKMRVLAGAFGTSRQQVLRLDDEPASPLPQGIEQDLCDRFGKLATDVDVVVVSDYGLGMCTDAVVDSTIKLAQQGVLVCVDSRNRTGNYKGVSAITPNVPEAEATLGREMRTPSDRDSFGEQLLAATGVAHCLLTQGRHGMTLFRPDSSSVHMDIVGEEEVTDVTGAGDTVIALFSLGLAAGLGAINAMRIANVAAGQVVMKQGAVPVDPAELCAGFVGAGIALEPWQS